MTGDENFEFAAEVRLLLLFGDSMMIGRNPPRNIIGSSSTSENCVDEDGDDEEEEEEDENDEEEDEEDGWELWSNGESPCKEKKDAISTSS